MSIYTNKVVTYKNALQWSLGLKIAIGTARGLSWLHHNCNLCIHLRNICSKCILSNDEYEPKISDFGLARLMNPIDIHLRLSVVSLVTWGM